MAYFQRVALILFFCIPVILPSTALADYPAEPLYYVQGMAPDYSSSPFEACMKKVELTQASEPRNSYNSNTETTCLINIYGYSSPYSYAISKTYRCNGVVNPNSATCPGSPPPTCQAGEVILDEYLEQNFGNQVACFEGCEYYTVAAAPGMDCEFSAGGTGICRYVYHTVMKKTGNVCEGTTALPSPAETSPDTCEQCNCFESGGSWGQVGDVNTCVPQGSAGSAPVKIAPPAVESSNTPAPTLENPNPTPVVTSEPAPIIVITPSSSGSGDPTITETTTNADGSQTTTTQSKGQYCAEKPTAALCNGDGTGSKNSFKGDCKLDGAADVVCDGDAIQCAIAKQAAELNCKFQPDQESKDAYAAMKAEGNSKSPALTQNRTVVALPSELDGSTPFSATCPEDMFFTIAGQQIRLPISTWCPYLAWVGNVFLGLAYILAARSLIGSL
jgi:hypothetical protein